MGAAADRETERFRGRMYRPAECPPARRYTSEPAVGHCPKSLFGEVADKRKDHLVGRIGSGDEPPDIFTVHPAQRSLTAENVVSERRTVENPVLKFVVYTVGRRILVEIYLIENHVLLLLYLMFRKVERKTMSAISSTALA